MKTFAIITLILILGFLICGVFTLLWPNAVDVKETALLMLGYGLVTLAYALASISFMSKSRRWRRAHSR